MSRLARAPERSSPCPRRERRRRAGGAIGEVLGQRRDRRAASRSCAALASATTSPSHGWGSRWSVPFIQSTGRRRAASAWRSTNSSTWATGRRRRAAPGRRCRSRPGGTRRAPSSRRAPTHRNAVRSTADGHAPPHDGVLEAEAAGGAGASGRRGRTCRAGSRPPWRRRRGAAVAMPSWRSRTSVSPETRNSSGSVYQGPTASGPAVDEAGGARASASGRTSR